jgi:phosphoglycolate phosphatase-like HAD superfamily hydrolase
MRIIQAVLFEPVGCLAEFPPEQFNEIAVRFFNEKERAIETNTPGSCSYWRYLELMETCSRQLNASGRSSIERLELQAVDRANPYEDVEPALSELKVLGTKSIITSSLSEAATSRFLKKFSLGDFFSAVWTRDNAGGIKKAPLQCAIDGALLKPEQVMFLADTAEGLTLAQELGVNSILMMNDPDEAMKLAAYHPAGGIVSLHELPDFIRFVAAENAGGRDT